MRSIVLSLATISASFFLDYPAIAADTPEVVSQKLEADVRAEQHEAIGLAKENPTKAVFRLKGALLRLDQDTVLPEIRRESLKRWLRDSIRFVESEARPANPRDVPGQDSVATELRRINELERSGKSAEARRLAGELREAHPDNQAVQAAVERLRKAAALTGARPGSPLGAKPNDNNRSNADIEYPDRKAWERISKRGASLASLSPKDRAVLEALNKAVPEISWERVPLQQALDHIQRLTGQPMLVDKAALDDLGLSYETAVSIRARNVSVRTLLRKVVGDLGLAYSVKDQTIHVTSFARAAEMSTVRVYYVGDLISETMFTAAEIDRLRNLEIQLVKDVTRAIFPNGVVVEFTGWNRVANPQFTTEELILLRNAAMLIQNITSVIDPASWKGPDGSGGLGTIVFDLQRRALIVRQSSEMHHLLQAGGLR